MPKMLKTYCLIAVTLTLSVGGLLGCDEELGPSVQWSYEDPIEPTAADKAPILYRANQYARRLGLALDAYYSRTGAYPAELSQLAPLDINPDQLAYPDQDRVEYKPLYEGQAYVLDYHASNPLGGEVTARFTSESIPAH